MSLTKRRVLAHWHADPRWEGTLSDLYRALGLKTWEHRDAKALVDALVEEGALLRRHHRLALPTPPEKAGERAPDARKQPGRPAAHAPPLRGILMAHRDGYAFVNVAERPEALFVPPGKVGGALDGDLVELRTVPGRDGRPVGTVEGVVSRARTALRGHLVREGRELWLQPLNERLPEVFIEGGAPEHGRAKGALVEVALTRFPESPEDAPAGRVTRVLDDSDTPARHIDDILFDLQLGAGFSRETGREMGALPAAVSPRCPAGREDLSALPFVTIDGEDARDFDDAVCLLPRPRGGLRLLVSIADVAHYVRPATAVDRDAGAKGTSVYFPARVLPMLPERLSNDLCSLRPREPRLTLTCDLELDAHGTVRSHRLYESLIVSRERLTYAQVQRLFDRRVAEPPLDPALCRMLETMLRLSEALAAKRRARGALALEFPEVRFTLDDAGMPRALDKAYPTQATRLIEQFMLEANEAVAAHCAGEGIPILYRVHDPPPPGQLEALRETLWNLGLPLEPEKAAQPGGFAPLLARVAEHPLRDQIHLAIIKSMAQAQYREANNGHFGLAAPLYTHFTSPIRRYPDLLVHRALKAIWHGGKFLALPSGAGLHLSNRERLAAEAESRVSRLYKVLHLEPHLGETFAGVIVGAGRRGAWIELAPQGVEALLPVESLHDDLYRYDPRRNALVGRRLRRTLGIGQRLAVQLVRASRAAGELEVALPTPARPTSPKRGGKRR